MSTSASDGVDLALEVIGFLYTSWNTANFDPRPVLRHAGDKTIIVPDETETGIDAIANADRQTTGYNGVLRESPTITVQYAGNTREAVGTEFDYDTNPEVTVTVEALTAEPGGVANQTSFRELVDETTRAIDDHRTFPLVQLNSRYAYRDLRVSDESPNPLADGNRDWYNTDLTVAFRGWEEY